MPSIPLIMKCDHLSITFSDVGLSRGKVGSKSQPVFVLFAGSVIVIYQWIVGKLSATQQTVI